MAENPGTVRAAQSVATRTAKKAGSTPEPTAGSAEPGTIDDVKFLADQFDMPVRTAAELVLHGDSPRVDEIVTEAAQPGEQDDALQGVPSPDEPASDLVEDQDEVRLKPVLHGRNDRAGGG